MYSPWCCFMTSKNVFCMKTTSVERFWAQASAYFCDLGLELVAGHDAVHEAALGHLARR